MGGSPLTEPKRGVDSAGRGAFPGDLAGCVLLAYLVGAMLSLHFDFPVLPHNDFVQFAQPARAYLEFRMPDSFKIMPAYPLAIALVSRVGLPDEFLVQAAEVVSHISTLVFLAFFWSLAKRWLPVTWPLALLYVVVNPYFLELSLQTLMEMFLLAGVTAGLWAFSRRSNGAFLISAVTGLTRYDSVFLIPLFGLIRFCESGRKRCYLVFGALAGLGCVAWVIASARYSKVVNPYVEEILDPTREFAGPSLLRMLGRMLVGLPADGWCPLSVWEWLVVGPLALLILFGAVRLWRRDRGLAVAMAGFVVTYFSIHAAFKAALARYNFPLLPFLILLLFLAVEPARRRAPARFSRALAAFLAGLGLAACLLAREVIREPHILALWLFGVAWVTLYTVSRTGPGTWSRLRAAALWVAVLLCLWPHLRIWERSFVEMRGRFSEFVAAYRWVRSECRPADRVLMVTPWYLTARYPQAEMQNFVSTQVLQSDDAWGFVSECRVLGVDYVVWLSYLRDFQRSDYFHQETRGYLLNEAGLGTPVSRPGFELVRVLEDFPGHYAFVYRFRPDQFDDLEIAFFDANRPDASPGFLGRGWSPLPDGPPGGRGVWGMGASSTFNLFLRDRPTGGRLCFVSFPMTAPGLPAQTVEVWVGGRKLGGVDLARQERTYAVELPPGSVRRGRNEFQFRYAFAAVPAEHGLGADVRSLAVLFKQIYFLPGQPDPAVQTGEVREPTEPRPRYATNYQGQRSRNRSKPRMNTDSH